MLKFNVITLLPNLFGEHLNNLPFKKAIQKDLIRVNLVNLREFALDSYGSVDDKPYGGGVGMIIRVEPIYNALQKIYTTNEYLETLEAIKNTKNQKVILLSPKGTKYTQRLAREYSNCEEITLICGRYEGVDARVENLVTDVISLGDFVLSGGELPALSIMESVTRLIPGILEKQEAAQIESFSDDLLEFPQYTRPEDFKGLKVPEILTSGNHKEIEKWRKQNQQKTSAN